MRIYKAKETQETKRIKIINRFLEQNEWEIWTNKFRYHICYVVFPKLHLAIRADRDYYNRIIDVSVLRSIDIPDGVYIKTEIDIIAIEAILKIVERV